MTEINNNKPEGMPQESPAYQQSMNAIGAYQAALRRQIQREQAPEFDPLMMYLSLQTLILEVTTLREMMLDIVSSTKEGVNLDTRMKLVNGYCMKLANICHVNVAEIETGPRIVAPLS